jgi:hypothetical protein
VTEAPWNFEDSLGQTLEEGDWVAYATTEYRKPVLKVGRITVLKFVPKMDGGYYDFQVKALTNTRTSRPERDRMVKIAPPPWKEEIKRMYTLLDAADTRP